MFVRNSGTCFPFPTASQFLWSQVDFFQLLIVINEVVRGAKENSLIKLPPEMEYFVDLWLRSSTHIQLDSVKKKNMPKLLPSIRGN